MTAPTVPGAATPSPAATGTGRSAEADETTAAQVPPEASGDEAEGADGPAQSPRGAHRRGGRRPARSRQRWPDVLGISWVLGFIVAYLSPTLKDGAGFGPADLARGLSVLTRSPGNQVLHNNVNGDVLTQMSAWNLFDWHAIHAGYFPLWNDLSANGLPQFLNFESGVLSLPSLVGYLAPASASLLVTVAMKMLIAGTGAYVCCRLLGTGPLAAAFGGTVAMLAGSFANWLGWAISGPEAWAGWLLAGVIIAYRRRGVAGAALLAVATAFAVYAGMPETDVLVGMGLGIVLAVTGAVTLARDRRLNLPGLGRIGAGLAAGAALSAPLWLPGLQVLGASARNGRTTAYGLPLHTATLLFAQGYDGLPIKGSVFFGTSNYYETAAYVGIPAIVLAIVGLAARWRRPVVAGLGAAIVGSLLITYRLGNGVVQQLLRHLGLSAVALGRMGGVMEALLAILAAIGLEAVIRRPRQRVVGWSFLAGSVAVSAVLADLWRHVGSVGLAAGAAAADAANHVAVPSHGTLEALRRSSLVWPSAEAVGMLAIGAFLVVTDWRAAAATKPVAGPAGTARERQRAQRPARWIGAILLVAESLFLLFAGVGINSYATTSYVTTPAVTALKRAVGNGLVGLDGANTTCAPTGSAAAASGGQCGVRLWQGIGLYPETNIAYGIDELGAHDPIIPARYFSAWPVPNAGQATNSLNLFAPSVDSLALAQRYGVDYVLAAPSRPRPAGMIPVGTIAGLTLYRVPGAQRFTLSPAGSVVAVTHPSDTTYDLTLHTSAPATLLMRITDVKGWHVVTGNGRSLAVRSADNGAFLAVTVPAGTRTLVVHYWPERLSIGLGLAALGAATLIGWALAGWLSRRRRHRRDQSPGRGQPQPDAA